eukprot:5879466-Pyramimonas_sp.AAC.1
MAPRPRGEASLAVTTGCHSAVRSHIRIGKRSRMVVSSSATEGHILPCLSPEAATSPQDCAVRLGPPCASWLSKLHHRARRAACDRCAILGAVAQRWR